MPAFDFKVKPNHRFTYYNPFIGVCRSEFYSRATTPEGLMRAACKQMGHEVGMGYLSAVTSIDDEPIAYVFDGTKHRKRGRRSYSR